ncbi:FadR/GntR family transcriptional regulator [Siculibacillus lacustris]|uniref:FadR/GntR family transcriptional regulator n=1 Tax=Siculibacillus lacustris TaxID=1549641 RepID=UPI0013F165B9|nr:FCD domain-containing protein [Siculibacillus lacustris]
MTSIETLRDEADRNGSPVGDSDDSIGRKDDTEFAELLESIRAIIAKTGSMPPERMVAEELSVKRHTLRRALGRLRAAGELEPARAGRRAASPLEKGRGLIESTNPFEVMELRMVLEPALARLAALRASPAEIERIRRAATTGTGSDPTAADMAFHKAIAAGSRNVLASELYIILHRVASDGRLRFTDSDADLIPERVKERDAEHRVIADAIASRDPEVAERAMWQHLAAIQQKIIGRLAPGGLF